VGAFPVEAAEAVCGDDRSGGVLDGLAVLVAHSLLQQTRADGRVRFHMLGTVREYALERLQDSGGAETARRAHAAYVLAVAQEAAAGLIGPVQAAALDRLARVHDDAVAALRWAVEANEADVALPLVAALWRFWSVRGPLDAADGWLAAALALGGGPAAARAEALRGAGFLAADAGDHVRAARSHVRRLALLRDLGDRRGAAEALTDLGIVLCDQGHTIAARHCLAQGLAVLRELDDRRGVAGALHHLGRVAREEGDPDRAAALLGESLAIRQELGDARGVALSLAGLGLVARLRNDPGGAAARFAESLALFRELGDAPGTAVALEQLAGAAVVLGEAARAARLFGAAEALRERLEVPAAPARRRDRDRDLGAARAALGPDAFAAAWAAGRALPPDAAVAEALAVGGATGTRGARPRSAWTADGAPGLTPREREVAALVAAGFSNRRIAEALVVSERTAEGHVERIRRKLGMHSRAQIAAWVARQALPDPAPRTE
jgi:DNA-binding CsgD family transcriptional regulator/tetratricopeptide (TPR) repeat protein